jgi:hypothetical protein
LERAPSLAIGLFVGSQSMGGIRALSATGGPGGSDTEAVLGSRAMGSGRHAATSTETMTIVVASATVPVADPAFKQTIEDIIAKLTAVQATVAEPKAPPSSPCWTHSPHHRSPASTPRMARPSW